MNLLFIDLFPMKSHSYLNNCFIKSLSKSHSVYFLSSSKLRKISKAKFQHKQNRVFSKFPRFISLYYILRYVFLRKKKIDVVFIPTFDTISFSLFSFLNKKKTFVLHHLNIDELENKIKLFFFNYYKNKINHLVFDETFKLHLHKNYNVLSYVGVVKHPIRDINLNLKSFKNAKKLCIALSQSNDENIIQNLIKHNENTSFLENNDIDLIIRSKNINYNKKNLKVYSHHLSNNIYQKYIRESSVVILLHPYNFIYRVSGVLFDSLSNKKFVLSSNTFHARKISLEYNSICKIANSSKDIFVKILEFKKNRKSSDDFNKFISQYSTSKFNNQLKKCIDEC